MIQLDMSLLVTATIFMSGPESLPVRCMRVFQRLRPTQPWQTYDSSHVMFQAADTTGQEDANGPPDSVRMSRRPLTGEALELSYLFALFFCPSFWVSVNQ